MCQSLKLKVKSVSKSTGPSGEPNCSPYVKTTKAVMTKIINKTNGSTVLNHGGRGIDFGTERSSGESFENYDDKVNNTIARKIC